MSRDDLDLCYDNGAAIARRATRTRKDTLMDWTRDDGTPDRRKIEFVADRMDTLRDGQHVVTGLAAWARTSDIGLLDNLMAPVERGSTFHRVLVETGNGTILVDLIGELYAAGVLSTRSCMLCTCLGGGVLVRAAGTMMTNTRRPVRPGPFGPFHDVTFSLAFAAPLPAVGLGMLAELHELADVTGRPAAPAGPDARDPGDPLAPPS